MLLMIFTVHQLDTIVELENPYSAVDPDIIAQKRQQMQDEIDEPPPVPPQNFEFPPVQKDKESILARKPSLREWPPRPEFEASSDSELGDNDREVEEVPHMQEKEDEGVVMNGQEEEETGAGNVQKNEENEDDFNPKFQIKLRKTMNIKVRFFFSVQHRYQLHYNIMCNYYNFNISSSQG